MNSKIKIVLLIVFIITLFVVDSDALVHPSGYESDKLQYFIMEGVNDITGGQDLMVMWYDVNDQMVGSTSLGDFPSGYKVMLYGSEETIFEMYVIYFLMGLAGVVCSGLFFYIVLKYV